MAGVALARNGEASFEFVRVVYDLIEVERVLSSRPGYSASIPAARGRLSRRIDVVVQMEQIGRVILALEFPQPTDIRAVGVAGQRTVIL